MLLLMLLLLLLLLLRLRRLAWDTLRATADTARPPAIDPHRSAQPRAVPECVVTIPVRGIMDVSPQIACVRLCVLLLPAVDDLSTKAVLGACPEESHASAHAEVDLSTRPTHRRSTA